MTACLIATWITFQNVIPDSLAIDKVTADFFNYTHSFFDNYAQFINVTLLGNEALSRDKIDLKTLKNHLTQTILYPDITDKIVGCLTDTQFEFIEDFNNKHQSLISPHSELCLNSHINPVLVESDDNRQVYDLTTNTGECRLFIKYRADKQDTKTLDYNSWLFTLTDSDKTEMKGYIDNGYNLVLALVCGMAELSGSEIAVVDKHQIEELISLGKNSITISRKNTERAYRISIGGGRENAMQIKSNRFEELF